MLHIVKQFMSVMTMGLKFGLEGNPGNNFDSWDVKNSDLASKKQEMKDYIDSLNTLEDDRLDSADSIYDSTTDQIKEELAEILVKLWMPADSAIFENGILISDIKEKIEEKITSQESVKTTSQEAREVLSADIISQFKNLEWEEYNNFQFNETVQGLQNFLISQWLLPRGWNSADGKWGPATRTAFETYNNNQSAKLEVEDNNTVLHDAEVENSNEVDIEVSQNYETLEEWVKTSSEQFMWIQFDKLDKSEILKEVHQWSLSDLLSKDNIYDLAIMLRAKLGSDNLTNFTFKNTLGFRNYSDAVDVLEDAWYNIKGWYLGTVEALWVIGTIDGVVRTQEKLANVDDYNEKLKIIFDYNADGLLDTKTAFYTQEKQMFDAVKNEEGFENVLKNLGYESLEQFNSEFENNYYSARENFKTQLARVLHSEYVIAPELMIQDPQAREKLNSSLQAISDEADQSIRENAKLQEIQEKYPELSQELQKKVVEQTKDIYLQHISGSIWEFNWVAATFNVKELTSSILDTASVGFINGALWLQIWKELYVSDDGKVKVSAGLVNIYPYLAASYKVNEWNIGELQNLFQRSSEETWYNVNVGWAISIAPVAWVQVEKMDEDTAEWIEKMTEEMSVMIDSVLDSNSFDELSLSEDNRDAYDRVKALQLASGNTEVSRELLKEGIINNYQRELFRDADSFNVTGVSLGVILKEDNLPLLGIHGEIKDQHWQENKNVIRSFDYNSTTNTESMNYATIEKMTELDSNLSKYREGFSEKTRWNTWSLALLNHENSIDQRWEGLKELSDWPKALRDLNFSDFVESHDNGSQDEKLAIISKVSSLMREGAEIKNAKSIWEIINVDKNRREGFNTNFGFDASAYANQYYFEFAKMDSMNSTAVHGTGFDAVSTLHVEGKHRISWVDVLHGNLDAIADENGNMLMIEISEKADTIAFAKTIETTNPELSQMILDGKVSLYFYKDPDGFDDRILPVVNSQSISAKESLGESNSWNIVDVYTPVNELTTWSIFASEKQEDKSNKWDVESDPENENQWESNQEGWTDTTGNDSTDWWTGFDPTNPGAETPITWETPTVEAPKNIPGTKSTSKVGMGHFMTNETYKNN